MDCMFVRTLLILYVTSTAMVACMTGNSNMANDDYDKDSIEVDTLASFDPFNLNPMEEAPNEQPYRIDETFDDFIFNFAQRPRLQMERVVFPHHLDAFDDELIIQEEDWKHIDLFDEHDYYTVFFNSQDDEEIEKIDTLQSVDFEHINLEKEIVRTFHFDKQDGKWMLTGEQFTHMREHVLFDFFDFYNRFTSDSVFAEKSLARNIHFVTTDPDDDFGQIQGTIDSSQWFTFSPELPSEQLTNINYGQTFADKHTVVMLKRGIANGLVDEITFKRTDVSWYLTRYEN